MLRNNNRITRVGRVEISRDWNSEERRGEGEMKRKGSERMRLVVGKARGFSRDQTQSGDKTEVRLGENQMKDSVGGSAARTNPSRVPDLFQFFYPDIYHPSLFHQCRSLSTLSGLPSTIFFKAFFFLNVFSSWSFHFGTAWCVHMTSSVSAD